MKGLNIKRIAAIGLGAALVGSALAPVVSAANVVPTGLDGLTKTNVIDSTGAPAVDVVVGANAAVSDVVWAGNIAARVAQLATTPAGGSSGPATVDVTVGGTVSTSGSGDTVESAVDYTAQEVAFNGIQVTDSKMPSLVNNTSAKVTWAGTESTSSVKEVLKGTADVDFQGDTSSSKYQPGQLFASVNSGDFNYTVELGGSGIPAGTALTNLDGNSDYQLSIPWLGKVYRLDQIKGTSADDLVFYADTTPTDLEVGQKIPVTPASGYAGKTMEIQLVDLIQVGSGNTTYQPKWALLIDGVAVKYVQKGADTSYDLRDQFGKSYFEDSIYVTAAGLNLSANKYTATVRTGSERIELKNGSGYPFTDNSTVDDKAAWKVVFTKSGSNVTKISLVNQWSYKKTSGSETDTSKFVLEAGEGVTLPNDFATFKFVGLQTKPTVELQVGDVSGINGGGIQYVDLRGNTINVPFYTQFDIDFNDPQLVTVAGKDYTFWIDNGAASYDLNVAYIEGDHTDSVVHTTWDNIDVNNRAILAASTVPLDLGAETKTGTTVNTNYLFVVDSNAGTAGLVLKGAQTFNIQNKADSTTIPKLVFNSTAGYGAYYVPNTEDFLETILGSTRGVYNSDTYLSASLTYTDNANDVASLFVATGDTGKVWEYSSIKSTDNNLLGPALDANTADWSIGEDTDNALSAALTEDGTMVESDGAVFTVTVPDENRNAEVYLGGTDLSTTTTGGTAFTGLAVNAPATQGGTTVTVTAVNGAGSGSGVNVVPVSDLVRTSKQSGKSIIVGGWLANAAAANLQVAQGQTLESLLIAAGDYVAAVAPSGDIVVAGYTAADTGAAAQDLINALEGLM